MFFQRWADWLSLWLSCHLHFSCHNGVQHAKPFLSTSTLPLRQPLAFTCIHNHQVHTFVVACHRTANPCGSRELRQSLVDLEEFFDILQTQSDLPDGDRDLPDAPPGYRAPHSTAAAAASLTLPSPAEAGVDWEPASQHHGQQHEATGADPASEGLGARRNSHALASSTHGSVAGSISDSSNGHYANGASSLSSSMAGWGQTVGLQVELDGVRFGYRPERQVRHSSEAQQDGPHHHHCNHLPPSPLISSLPLPHDYAPSLHAPSTVFLLTRASQPLQLPALACPLCPFPLPLRS